MRRHRPGLGWFLVVVAVCAIAACVIVGMMQKANGAELPLRPGEIDLLTKVVAAEARGESETGQRAIAWVAINRMQDAPETFGKTLTRVLLAPSQFARPIPLADNSRAYLRALLATTRAVLGEGGDPSLGATYFFRKDMKPWPHWAKHLEIRIVIGNHVFLRERD